ncbi:S41 family peptidase [Vulgatibacter incomptus]|uniref:Carboxyl-terminal protease n=1 Tax=Vulgatibacter incomptus TaxID=1391653 RepID=A0A0K1PB44_9BACT|nr:S41 family peptidase [Vulgatibacter incomptus]AKU90349.1 Carboxyl-terminal protease [Vulgatibacter incomptus]
MRHRRIPLLVLVAVTAFGAGGLFSATVRTAWAADYGKLDVFAKVLAYVENHYVDEVDGKKLVYGAVKGMLATLDPHSTFLPPDELREMRNDTAGEFGGLGVEISAGEDALLVVSPLDDSPASRAGILPGDRILAIDGERTKGMTVLAAVKRMRGEIGTKVAIELSRDGFKEPRTLTLQRDLVRVESVVSKLYPGGYGYVRIKSFQDRTDVALLRALLELRKQNGGADLQGLVLDLRNNPGGLLDQAVRVADRFLPSGVIVSTEGRGGTLLATERAHSAGTEANYPMIVLVNGGSASASEVVAGALQDHARAVIMGSTTFGKGSVQSVIDLDDGSGLKLTIARYYTPNHRSIQGKGIVPDVVVAGEEPPPVLQKDPKEKDLPGALPPLDHKGVPPNVALGDAQLRTALETLHTWEIFQARAGRSAATAANDLD